jgi:hypothetical protein
MNHGFNTTSEILVTTGENVSPVTISPEWSRVGRLLMMSGLSVLGSVGNVYMISAVIVEEHLSRRGW